MSPLRAADVHLIVMRTCHICHRADGLDSLEDLERMAPGEVHRYMEYFETYKLATRGQRNTYANNGDAVDRDGAMEVIRELRCASTWHSDGSEGLSWSPGVSLVVQSWWMSLAQSRRPVLSPDVST